MILDGRKDDGRPTDYDLVIVGAGPAGISLAQELRDTGLRIALLESGGEDFDDAAQALNAGTIEGNDDEYELEFARLRQLGGTSNHWGGYCTPLDAIDFDRAPPGFSGWPLSRDDLLPFYARAQDYCDVGRFEYDAAVLAPDDPDYRLFADNPDFETTVLRQSGPTRFGDKYRAAIAASGTTDLWLWTNAMRVSTDGGDGEWVETRTTGGGPDRRFTARAVVLAAGAIEAARLMLWSNAENGTRTGDAGSLLGATYMDHPSGGAAFLHFARPQATKLYWSGIDTHADGGVPLHFLFKLSEARLAETGLPNAQFYIFPFADDDAAQLRKTAADASLKGMKTVAKWALGRDVRHLDVNRAWCDGVTGADELVRQKLAEATGRTGVTRVLFKYEVEQLPDRENRVALSTADRDALGMPRPVLTWTPSQDSFEGVRETMRLVGQAAGAAELGRLQIEDHGDDPWWGSTTAWHQLGCMRMAESPTQGVVDPDLRVHGAGALYVASGAVFPTVGRSNPTLTIVALSIRLADHLKERLA